MSTYTERQRAANAELHAIETELEGLRLRLGKMTERRRRFLLTEAQVIAKAQRCSVADALGLIAGCVSDGAINMTQLAGLH